MPDGDVFAERDNGNPGWGYVAMQVTDHETRRKLIEEDADYIDVKYVGPASRLVTRVRCVWMCECGVC